MNRVLGVVIIMAFGVITIVSGGNAQAPVDDQEIEEIEGVVTEIDVVGRVLAVKGMNPKQHKQELRFIVPNALKIVHGCEDIWLQDVNIADQVVVRYYRNTSGELVAVSITDNNPGNQF